MKLPVVGVTDTGVTAPGVILRDAGALPFFACLHFLVVSLGGITLAGRMSATYEMPS